MIGRIVNGWKFRVLVFNDSLEKWMVSLFSSSALYVVRRIVSGRYQTR